MSDVTVSKDDRAVVVEFDESLYPRDAIYGAAYVFLDRCYVHLDRPRDGRVAVTLRAKPNVAIAVDDLAGELQNELLGQAWRRQIFDDNRAMIEAVSARAIAGAAGPPGLDDLLALDDGGDAFEDPLGIARSWEEKYKKKKEPAEKTGEPPSGTEPAT